MREASFLLGGIIERFNSAVGRTGLREEFREEASHKVAVAFKLPRKFPRLDPEM